MQPHGALAIYHQATKVAVIRSRLPQSFSTDMPQSATIRLTGRQASLFAPAGNIRQNQNAIKNGSRTI